MQLGSKIVGHLLGSLLLSGAMARSARADCPADTIEVCGMVVSVTPSSSATGCGPLSDATGTYNLPAGTVSAQSDADYPDGHAVAHVTTEDIYFIVGPPLSSPISFSADLVAHGHGSSYYCTSASGSATLRSDAGMQQVTFHGMSCQGEGVDRTVSLPQLRMVGEPFHLIMDVVASPSPGASAAMDASLAFSGLPPGYAIESCQGYSSNPTPARPASWGQLKVRYR